MTSTTGNLSHNPTNDTRMQEFMKDVRKLASDAAAGQDSLASLAVRTVRAMNDGVLSLDIGPDGKDDAARVYELWQETQSKKSVHTHTSGGFKANVSKLRQLMKFGAIAIPGIDPVEILDKAKLHREDLIRSKIKVKPAYASFVDVARRQLDTDQALSDDELRETVTVQKSDPDLEKKIKSVMTTLEKLVTGEGKDGLRDQSPQIVAAFEQVRERYGELVALASDAELDRRIAEREARNHAAAPEAGPVETEPSDGELLGALMAPDASHPDGYSEAQIAAGNPEGYSDDATSDAGEVNSTGVADMLHEGIE